MTLCDAESRKLSVEHTSVVFFPVSKMESRKDTNSKYKKGETNTAPQDLHHHVYDDYGADGVTAVVEELTER